MARQVEEQVSRVMKAPNRATKMPQKVRELNVKKERQIKRRWRNLLPPPAPWFMRHLPSTSPLVSTPTEKILSESELPDIGICVVAADCKREPWRGRPGHASIQPAPNTTERSFNCRVK